MKFNLLSLTIMLFAIIPHMLNSQDYTVDVFDDELFLENYINEMAQDSQGNIWFAGTEKMIVYDGNSFSQVNIPNTFGGFKSVCCEQDGTLWAGGWLSFSKRINGVWENIDVFGMFPTVNDIAIDNDGNVWACEEDLGVAKYDGNEWTIFTQTDNGTPLDRLTQLAFDNDGKLWIGSKEEIFTFDGNKWEIIDDLTNIGVGVFSGKISANKIRVAPDGKVWMAVSDGGIIFYDGSDWSKATFTYGGDDATSLFGDALAIDQQGLTWCNAVYIDLLFNHNGSDESGTAFIPDPWVDFNYPSDIFVDKENRVWVASSGGGDYDAQVQRITQPLVNGVDDTYTPFSNLIISPNPAKDHITCQLEMPAKSDAGIKIYDLQGNTVVVQKQNLSKGKNELSFDVANMMAGIYFIEITTNEVQFVGKVMVNKI